jgi:hypothetical protein|tara:strand:- start:240 stop:605 length:366 start_codon:yes stop_codon:yes gene_type:complete
MKSNEFKKILKPLIKQAVREVILEEGLLSNIVAEVATGLQGNLVVEAKNEKIDHSEEDLEHTRQEKIKRLNESSKISAAFSGTQELRDTGQGPLAGVGPDERGVDISAIQKIANGKWKQLI